MDWVKVIELLIRLLPLVISTIKQIQESFPNATGPQKHERATGNIMAVVEAVPEAAAIAKTFNLKSWLDARIKENVDWFKSAHTPGFSAPPATKGKT